MNTKKNPGNVVFSFGSAAAIVAPSVAWAKVNIRRPALIDLAPDGTDFKSKTART
ncbi:MAG: hypothetical protein PHY05_05565 [Methanothrix sp.]|nr:hypothetical protein [Methanothrix sp.]